MIAYPPDSRVADEKEAAESLAGVEGEGGDYRLEGQQDAGRVGAAVRHEPSRIFPEFGHGSIAADFSLALVRAVTLVPIACLRSPFRRSSGFSSEL